MFQAFPLIFSYVNILYEVNQWLHLFISSADMLSIFSNIPHHQACKRLYGSGYSLQSEVCTYYRTSSYHHWVCSNLLDIQGAAWRVLPDSQGDLCCKYNLVYHYARPWFQQNFERMLRHTCDSKILEHVRFQRKFDLLKTLFGHWLFAALWKYAYVSCSIFIKHSTTPTVRRSIFLCFLS